MKKLLLFGAVLCGGVLATSSAKATPPLLVVGAGGSTVSGHVVVNARATGQATGEFIPVAPAVGSLRVRGSWLGDLSGSVTCIGLAGPNAAIVSGNLDTPFVSGGFTLPNFSLIVVGGHDVIRPWIEILPDSLAGLFPCGTSLFFSAGIPDLPNDVVVNGQFLILGAT